MQIFRQIANDRHVAAHVVERDLFAFADPTRGADWLPGNCRTKSPAGIARVANRWPGVTAPVSVTTPSVCQLDAQTWLDRGLDDRNVVGRVHDDRVL